ncbi:MAG: hypothetical protein M3285_10545 [Actinomycetota bacterium]|nr:hypothetical protein [Actinomycetota bacterium]
MKKIVVALLTASVLVVACGDGDGRKPEDQKPEAPPPSTLRGVITEVDSSGLTEVKSFTLSVKGEIYKIFLADDIELGFPPAHLNEHKTTGDPVRVDLEGRSGKLYATSIADA